MTRASRELQEFLPRDGEDAAAAAHPEFVIIRVRDADNLVIEESICDCEISDFAPVDEHESTATGGKPDLSFRADLNCVDIPQPDRIAGQRHRLALVHHEDAVRSGAEHAAGAEAVKGVHVRFRDR